MYDQQLQTDLEYISAMIFEQLKIEQNDEYTIRNPSRVAALLTPIH